MRVSLKQRIDDLQGVSEPPRSFLLTLNRHAFFWRDYEHGRTFEGLAKELAYHESTLTKWLTGVNRIPLNKLEQLISIFGLSVDERLALLKLGGYQPHVILTGNVVLHNQLREELEELLPSSFKQTLHDTIPTLAAVLAEAIDQHRIDSNPSVPTPMPQDVRTINSLDTLAPSTSPLIQALAGQRLALGNAEITFGRDDLSDRIVIRDLARGLELHMGLDPTPPTPQTIVRADSIYQQNVFNDTAQGNIFNFSQNGQSTTSASDENKEIARLQQRLTGYRASLDRFLNALAHRQPGEPRADFTTEIADLRQDIERLKVKLRARGVTVPDLDDDTE